MPRLRIKDVRLYNTNHSGWWDTIPAVQVMLVQHLYDDHGLSIRKINQKLAMTDRAVKACLTDEARGLA